MAHRNLPRAILLSKFVVLNVFLTFFSRNYMHSGKNARKTRENPTKTIGWLDQALLEIAPKMRLDKITQKNIVKTRLKNRKFFRAQFVSDPPEGQVRLCDLRPLAYRGKSGFLGSHLKTDSRKCSLFVVKTRRKNTLFFSCHFLQEFLGHSWGACSTASLKKTQFIW